MLELTILHYNENTSGKVDLKEIEGVNHVLKIMKEECLLDSPEDCLELLANTVITLDDIPLLEKYFEGELTFAVLNENDVLVLVESKELPSMSFCINRGFLGLHCLMNQFETIVLFTDGCWYKHS